MPFLNPPSLFDPDIVKKIDEEGKHEVKQSVLDIAVNRVAFASDPSTSTPKSGKAQKRKPTATISVAPPSVKKLKKVTASISKPIVQRSSVTSSPGPQQSR